MLAKVSLIVTREQKMYQTPLICPCLVNTNLQKQCYTNAKGNLRHKGQKGL